MSNKRIKKQFWLSEKENQELIRKANSLGFVDVIELEEELDKLNRFEAEIETFYLRPVKSQLKWK